MDRCREASPSRRTRHPPLGQIPCIFRGNTNPIGRFAAMISPDLAGEGSSISQAGRNHTIPTPPVFIYKFAPHRSNTVRVNLAHVRGRFEASPILSRQQPRSPHPIVGRLHLKNQHSTCSDLFLGFSRSGDHFSSPSRCHHKEIPKYMKKSDLHIMRADDSNREQVILRSGPEFIRAFKKQSIGQRLEDKVCLSQE